MTTQRHPVPRAVLAALIVLTLAVLLASALAGGRPLARRSTCRLSSRRGKPAPPFARSSASWTPFVRNSVRLSAGTVGSAQRSPLTTLRAPDGKTILLSESFLYAIRRRPPSFSVVNADGGGTSGYCLSSLNLVAPIVHRMGPGSCARLELRRPIEERPSLRSTALTVAISFRSPRRRDSQGSRLVLTLADRRPGIPGT